MEHAKITIIRNGIKEQASLNYDDTKGLIVFSMLNGFIKTYKANDLYLCLAKIRHEHPEILFLCKGAKLNVTPSRMCSQMSGGAIAYDLKPGIPATRDDIVQIFDYEEENLSKDLKDQQNYYNQWIKSLQK
ncbi:hypothetical protein C2E19_10440 [Pseudomonas sp. DTU12.3]|uniref:Uncharacterized protein n=1 Tax=Pseudomonas helmanticensis TaxID=1471381 RepID=A0ACD2U4L1_9PSED|nr:MULTISPECIES: hypothetical protein [Pseudomonas]QAX84256.1 hypothetical protein C2E19_10440 [Pseudomonas sp. DTU12.3]SMQ25212.1 hypothetical protein SAMN04488483_2153 [Pseudomonas helmanticensis]